MGTRTPPGCRLVPSLGLHYGSLPRPTRQDSCELCGGDGGRLGRAPRASALAPAPLPKSSLWWALPITTAPGCPALGDTG